MQKVLNKLSKKKTSLNKRKVNLSLMDEIRDNMEMASGITYTLEESGFLDAFDVVRNAYSYIEYDFATAFNNAEGNLEMVNDNLRTYGIETPEEIAQWNEELEYYRETANELIDLLSQLRASIPDQQKF
jgi:hypothetical protein